MQYYQFAQMFGSDPNTSTQIQQYLQQIAAQLDPTTLGQQTLNYMVDNVIVEQEAKKRGITVSDAEISDNYQQILGFYPGGTPTPVPTDLATEVPPTLSATQLALVTATPTATATPLPTATSTPSQTVTTTGTVAAPTGTTTALAETATPTLSASPTVTSTQSLTPTATALPTLTPTPYTTQEYAKNFQDYLNSLKTQANITPEEYRNIVRIALLRQKLMKAMTSDITSKQEEIWTKQVTVKDLTTAEQVVQKVKAGQDFSKVATEVTTDTVTKSTGGDQGWQFRYQMDPAVANAAFALQNPGDVSQPVQTSNGYVVIQLVGKQPHTMTASELQTAQQTVFQNWLTGAQKTANIKKYDSVWQGAVPTEPTIPAQYQQSTTP
jgi:parvulin-like peptidyl-prolyl isomerase